MGSRTARLTVGIAGFVVGACAGEKAVGVAAKFVQAARSVRMQVKDGSADAARQVEIVCPDRVRVTAETTSGRLEIVAVGDQAFGRTGAGAWIKVPLALVNAPVICAGAPWRRGSQDLATILQAMTSFDVSEQPVGPREVNGVACQDWEARSRSAASADADAPRVGLCLGTSDRRPMQITLPDATWTFAEWNPDLVIEPPSAVAGEPSAAP
jgi:hypothetical protein